MTETEYSGCMFCLKPSQTKYYKIQYILQNGIMWKVI